MHYNTPGIRGEPRYLEGVVRFTKLHGSLDWMYDKESKNIKKIRIPFGKKDTKKDFCGDENLLIYPNSAKDRETAEYPYVELFRDFAAAICRPNNTLVIFGYGFGDEHINRVISDMLSLYSTHLVVISYDDPGGRIYGFYDKELHKSQVSLLIGEEFGDIEKIVKYLSNPSIDEVVEKMVEKINKNTRNSECASSKDEPAQHEDSKEPPK